MTRLLTLWESICKCAGPDGTATVSIDQAVEDSAVTAGIAEVEIRRLETERLLTVFEDGKTLALTELGRRTFDNLQ